MVEESFNDFLDLLIPRHCSGCRRMLVKGEPEVCTGCRSRIPVSDSFNRPQDNELMDRLKGRIPLSHALYYTWFRKRGIMQSILHGIKYAHREQSGILLGNWMGHELRKRMMHIEFDYLVPVPMHESKIRTRGYNQSERIAHGMSEITDIPVASMLERVSKATTQTRLNRWQRWLNSEEIYSVSENLIKGSRVLLIDDIMTTGATAEACVLQLQKHGVSQTGLAAIALTL